MMAKVTVLGNNENVCFACIGFNVGAINEDRLVSGISHLLEHLLFTKSKKSFLLELYAKGFSFNAITKKDCTYYYVQGTADQYKTIIDCVVNIVKNLDVTSSDLELEKKIVTEEMHNNTRGGGLQTGSLIPYLNHTNPYRNSVIGSYKSLKSITLHDLRQYFKRYYLNPSCVLNVDRKIQDAASKYLQKNLTRLFTDARPTSIVNINHNFSLSAECMSPFRILPCPRSVPQTFLIGFVTIPYNDPRRCILELFAFILTNRLLQELREKLGMIYSCKATNVFYKYVGCLGIRVSSMDGKMDVIINKCFKLIHDTIQCNGFDFTKMKRGFLTSIDVDFSNVESRSRHALFDLLYDNPVSIESLTSDLLKLDKKQFMETAKELVKFDRCSVILSINEKESPYKKLLQKLIEQHALL